MRKILHKCLVNYNRDNTKFKLSPSDATKAIIYLTSFKSFNVQTGDLKSFN